VRKKLSTFVFGFVLASQIANLARTLRMGFQVNRLIPFLPEYFGFERDIFISFEGDDLLLEIISVDSQLD